MCGHVQALSAFIQQQEQLQPIIQQQFEWAEQLIEADAHAAAAAAMPSAAPLLVQQQQQHVLASHTSSCQLQQPALHAFTPAEAVQSGTLQQRPLVPGGTGYMMRLMESATPQDVQQALLMTPESMIQYYMQVFKALVTLIELARRPAYDSDLGSGDDGVTHNGGLGSACSCCGADAVSEAMDAAAPDDQQQQQSSCAQGSAVAEAAAAPGNADTAAAASALRATCSAARQQLDFYMDHLVLMSTLTQFHNPLVMWTLAASNLVTRQPAAAPPQHWLMVRAAQSAEKARIRC
jgi:hypothetical protein